MAEPSAPNSTLLYGLDDKPPLPKAIVLGFQHVLTMFGSTVAIPLLFAPVLWPIPEGLPAELADTLRQQQITNTALLISCVMLCSGVATLIQSTLGSRLPIIQGVSFSFIAAFFGIIAATLDASPIDWEVAQGSVEGMNQQLTLWQDNGAAAMRNIAGAVIGGAVIEMVIGFSGLMGLVRRILSPVVVGPVIMLIGLALYPFGAANASADWPIAILTIVLIVLCAFVLGKLNILFRMFPMLIAILGAVSVCAVLAQLDVFQAGGVTADGVAVSPHPARPDLSAFNQSDWFRTATVFFPWGLPEFKTAFIVAVLAGYLASMIESFGDYHACKNVAHPQGNDPTSAEVSRGIGCEGVGCALTGVFGGFSSTSYSENIGLVGLTKVGSRFVVQIGAVILVLLGLFGKFGALAAAIPGPVVGGLYCAMFGLIAAVGVRQFAKADLTSDRNLFIGGFALFMGLSLPYYFAADEGGAYVVNAYFGGLVESGIMSVGWADGISSVINAVGNNGMGVAAVLGIVLDNVIPGTKAERGLEPRIPSTLIPEADDVDADDPAAAEPTTATAAETESKTKTHHEESSVFTDHH
ncbi:MAG: solute carrier family 23 protein [Planctomycetota bacterium]